MKLRLYLDENTMQRSLVKALQQHGVNVTTARDASMVGYPDEEHLAYATQEGRALYSFNASDFYLLHTRFLEQGLSHAGIILAQQGRYSVGEQMRRLLNLIASKSAEEMKDQLEFLSAWD